MKKKFQVLTKKPDYDPIMMCKIVRACTFLWNFGLLCADNKGYCPDEFIIEDHDQLKEDLGATTGGALVRDRLCHYLWQHK